MSAGWLRTFLGALALLAAVATARAQPPSLSKGGRELIENSKFLVEITQPEFEYILSRAAHCRC